MDESATAILANVAEVAESVEIHEPKSGGEASQYELRAIGGVAPGIAVEPKLDARSGKWAKRARIDSGECAANHRPRHPWPVRDADERRRLRVSASLPRVGCDRLRLVLRQCLRVGAARAEHCCENDYRDRGSQHRSALVQRAQAQSAGRAATHLAAIP